MICLSTTFHVYNTKNTFQSKLNPTHAIILTQLIEARHTCKNIINQFYDVSHGKLTNLRQTYVKQLKIS